MRDIAEKREVLSRQGGDELTPPKRLVSAVGGGDFEGVGQEFFKYFVELAGLKPNARILDVGSGSGRMAVPLTKYLNQDGSYDGFDIVPDGVKWCIKKITPKYPKFNFQLADVYNEVYNPQGTYQAADYRFPYPDESFDFIFLTSVFTHLLPRDMEHYLSEIVRVLKVNGRCFITFFLLNQESLQLTGEKRGVANFEYSGEGYKTVDPAHPEEAIAFPEEFIISLYGKYGLKVKEPIHYGAWCGRQNFLSYQDIVIAVKEHHSAG